MRGDFSSLKNDPSKHFMRVLLQQGRPQLDADWNQQGAILLDLLRQLAADLIGRHGGPEENCGFRIIAEGDDDILKKDGWSKELIDKSLAMLKRGEGDFLIAPGRYYVNGFPCTNLDFLSFSDHVEFEQYALQKKKKIAYLIYLDAWERHLTQFEESSIVEPALRGKDTCSRSQLVWKVAALELNEQDFKDPAYEMVKMRWHEILENWQSKHRGLLRVRATESAELDPSTPSTGSGFRGLANQLYRIEIHRGGDLASEQKPTFKFSRENGSVIFPVAHVDGKDVTLGSVGRDTLSRLRPGDWIEIVDDDYELERRAEPLLRVDLVTPGSQQVTLSSAPQSTVGQNPEKHPILRRWDHQEGDPRKGGLELREGAALIKESDHDSYWLALENGIQVQFRKGQHSYRTGDYWTVPARVATSDVEWPRHRNEPQSMGPQGVDHHYAPLAIISYNGKVFYTLSDCRLKFKLPSQIGA
jgi:hypothetical protein